MTRNDIAVTVLMALQATVAVIVATSPATLGIPQVVAAWIGIAAVPLGIILNRLDTIGASATPPKAPGPP